MPIYTLAAKPYITTAVQAGHAAIVSERIVELAVTNGYVVGPGGIQVMRDGSVVIDLDRDPTADWAAFDPEAYTQAEQEAQAEREAVIAVIGRLEAGTSNAAEVMAAVAWLGRRYFESIGEPLP